MRIRRMRRMRRMQRMHTQRMRLMRRLRHCMKPLSALHAAHVLVLTDRLCSPLSLSRHNAESGEGTAVVVRKEQKSVQLMMRLIETFTDPGEVIFDPFMGTGTTLVAAMLLGRPCYGMDKDSSVVNNASLRLADVAKMLKEGKHDAVFRM